MTRSLARLIRTSPAEVLDRTIERAVSLAERVSCAAGLERWDRRTLLRRLAGPLDAAEVREAVNEENWAALEALVRRHFNARAPRFVISGTRRSAVAEAISRRFPDAARHARARGDAIRAGRLDLLGYERLSYDVRDRGTWHVDPVHRREAPLTFWASVPFLDPAIGDHKVIWELNRHQHWLPLGRAAWLTGDPVYAERFLVELRSWFAGNPPLLGINWASMLELSLRSISWIWALHFFNDFDGESEQAREPWRIDLLLGLDRQLRHVERHLSTWFSPNTHLLGEGLALYVVGRVIPELRAAPGWEALGRRILLQEAHAQVNADGGHAERSAHYHRYALDFYLLALSVARVTGDPAADPLAEVVARLARFCRALATDDGRLPMLGDDDGGMLFPICGRDPLDASDSLCLAAALLSRPDLAAGQPPEEVFWMWGGEPPAVTGRIPPAETRAFDETGYIVVRAPEVHAVLDVGPHGFLNGGHAHADALNLVLSFGGRPLLIDPGTATYTMDPEVRDRFRSSAMHNTLELDGRPQSQPAGPFHWRSRTDARSGLRRSTPAFDCVEGYHHGYSPAVHRRVLLRTGLLWTVVDHVLDSAPHSAAVHWHLDPAWTIERETRTAIALRHRDGFAAAIAATARTRHVLTADTSGLGWSAPRYGRIVPSPTLRLVDGGAGPFTVTTAVAFGESCWPLSIEVLPVAAERQDGWHRTAVLVRGPDSSTIVLSAAPGGAEPAARSLQRVPVLDEDTCLITDARVAVLTLTGSAVPRELHLVEATIAIWTGIHGFDVGAAGDLHLDEAAMAGLGAAERWPGASEGN